ncbi:MAG: peptidase domain-containing ABC transporter [Clostridium sp.]|nr:peptidase domain-containing ABC transporter [Clostridium sp.]
MRQRDAMQCGVACLCMAARMHGARISVDELEEVCQPTAEGVSLKGIMDGAAAIGLKGVASKVGLESVSQLPLPAILHWNQNHFVVLHKTSRDGSLLHVADPAKGMVKYSREEFARHWASAEINGQPAGVALILEPEPEFLEHAREDKRDSGASLAALWKYAKSYRGHFLTIGLLLLLGSALQLVLPFLTQWIVDKGIRHGDIKIIWLILLGELMIVIGRTAADFTRRWLLLHISMRINISLVSDFFIKLLKLPMSFFDTKLMGDLLQRMADHGRVQQFLTGQALGLMFTMLSFIVLGAVLFVYSKLIFTVFLVGSAIYGLWIARFLARRKTLDYDLFEQQAKNQNQTYQFITSMQEIKLQGCERRRRQDWEDAQMGLFAVQMKSLKLQQAQEAGSIFINEVKNILITVLAAMAVIDGNMTLGAMLAVQYIIGQLNSPVEQLMAFIYSLQDVKISLERINEIHRRKNEEADRENIAAFCTERSIVFDNVEFRYDKHALKNTLSDISLTIPEGKVTAIVGASGSGKTTLVKLMLGYYPVNAGALRIAGRDIGEYDMKWWRSQCGAVMQDGVIFSESIERNIAIADGEIDRERLERAARIACIHDYVMSLPLRYNTKIGRDGVGLSQGQKQRILIARAVYRDPSFIFFDEATNALDAKNERAIVENLADFYRGRTVVVVAHRLSTVKDADQIIVIEGGRIAEIGAHAELIARKGAYYSLVKNQLELGQ